MQELVQQLMSKAGLSEAQATQSIATMKAFIQSKLPPQMAAMVDNFFSGNLNPGAAAGSAAKEEDWMDKAKATAGQAGEKIEDFAQDAAEKAKQFAQQAGKKAGEWADKAEDLAEDAIEKLKGLFDGKKDDEKPEDKK